MVRLVMLVALLITNIVDAPGISWINYVILVYDIISAVIARLAGLTKRSQKTLQIDEFYLYDRGTYLRSFLSNSWNWMRLVYKTRYVFEKIISYSCTLRLIFTIQITI